MSQLTSLLVSKQNKNNMGEYNMISVAAVQHPSNYLNRGGCLERAVEIIKQAANDNIELLVFPKGWLPGYPMFVWK
ncbi:MAG: nitrilase [Parasphingorhabdus sp.]|jgi:nitrilase